MRTRKHDWYDPIKHEPVYGLQVKHEGQWKNAIAMMDAGHEKLCEIIENRRGFASDVYLAMVNACAHQSHVADEQAIMVMVYEYAKISEGFDAAEGEQRTKQRKAMATKAAEIRAALSAPQEAAERPANFTELWELYSRVGDAHENHGRNHEKTMEARATFHAALMRALSAPQEAGKVEPVAGEAVAWQERQQTKDGWTDWYNVKAKTAMGKGPGFCEIIGGIKYQWRSLYLRPSQQALSDEEIIDLARVASTVNNYSNGRFASAIFEREHAIAFARAILAAAGGSEK